MIVIPSPLIRVVYHVLLSPTDQSGRESDVEKVMFWWSLLTDLPSLLLECTKCVDLTPLCICVFIKCRDCFAFVCTSFLCEFSYCVFFWFEVFYTDQA